MATGISFDGEDVNPNANGTVGLDDSSNRKIPDNVAARQAARADYGLGPDSPGKDTIANSISSGTEDSLRGTASAAQEMKETAAAARRLLSQATKTGPITQDDVDLVRGSQTRQPIDPGVVFELGYGRKIVNDLASQNPDSSSVFNRATAADPANTYKHMDAASEIIAKQGIVDRLLENRKADWAATSWWDATPDLVESVVPLLSASRMRNVVGVDGSLLPGNNLEEQVQGLLLMPPSQFKQKLEEVTDELYTKNPLDAIRFMEAVKSYGAEDKYLDNLFSLADALGVGEGVVGVAKLGGKLTGSAAVKAAKLPAEAAADIAGRQSRKALKDAVKAAAKDPSVPEDIFAAAGQVEKAADISALRKVGVLPDVGMTDAEILARNLPSAARVDRIVSDAGSLTREAADRLASKLKTSIGGSDEALGITVRNTRLNPQQLEIAVEETKAALRREFEKTTDSVMNVRNDIPDRYGAAKALDNTVAAVADEPLSLEDDLMDFIKGMTEDSFKVDLKVVKQYFPNVAEADLKAAGQKLRSQGLIDFSQYSDPKNVRKNNHVTWDYGAGEVHTITIQPKGKQWSLPTKETPKAVDNSSYTLTKSKSDPRVHTITKDGKEVGEAVIAVKDGVATIRDIYSTANLGYGAPQNSLGKKAIMNILKQFVQENPEVKTLKGERVSGARRGGKHDFQGTGTDIEMAVPEAWRKAPVKAEAVTTKLTPIVKVSTGVPDPSTSNVINIRHNNVEGNVSNVETVTIELGAPRATPLPTEDLARHYAEDIYGLPEGSYQIAQKGDSFTIEITRAVDETTDAVRAPIVTNNPDPTEGVTGFMDFLRQPNRILPGFLKSADESLSEFQNTQRKAVQFGFNSTIGELKDMIQPIAALSKAEKRDLEKVLSYNRDYFNVKTGDRGFFYDTVADLEEGFQRSVGRLPSENEIEAYFRYTQLSDLDWGFRNFSLYRDKARLGLKQYSVEFMKVDEGGTAFPRTPPFDGKKVDNLPWNGEPATVLHFKNGGKDAEVFNTKAVNNVTYEDMIKNQGYSVIQVDNPVQRPFRDVLQNNEVIQYVLTKELKEHPLPLKQLDYNPGGHVEYQHDWFLKQPRISVGRGGQKFYEGDTAVLNFTSEAQTRKFEKAINEARLALKAGDEAALDNILGKRLPWTKDEFKNLFTGDEALSLDEKFHVIKRGRSSIQEVKAIRDENPGIRDYTDSAHNLSGEANRKFVGARNGPLMTVKTSGDDTNPMLRLAPAKLIDPLQTMGRSLSNAANNRFFGDYKAGAIEDFIARHAGAMKTSNRDLKNFPMYYLHNPEWDESKAAYGAVMAAKNDRRAIMNFVGEQSTLGRVVENTKQRIYNSIFNTFGEDATTKVVNWTSNKSGENIDPAGYFRAVAFHTKLGLFNPLQYPLQAMGATHAIALSPKHGLNAAISYFPTRWLGLHPSDELIESAAQKMKSFGWKPEDFKESIKAMREVGYDSVGREHAWKDNIADPQMFGDPGSSFLDKGSFFFNEGERTNRIISWHTAYREWREANPLKTLDANEMRSVLNRADLFGLNMTRASAAGWQKGLLSIPTQFLSYNARMMDQFLGKRLTPAEKTRAFVMYSAMYGIPSAGSAVTGYTFYDDIRKTALEKGWNTDDVMFKALHEGVLSTMTSLATGTDYNIASRYGPGGMKPIKELMTGDKSLAEFVGGASGSIVGDILSTSSPFVKDTYDVFKNGGPYEPVLQDMIEASRNISSVNNAFKVLHALNTGKYITKNGKSQGELSGAQAILGGITGLQPQEFTDMSLKQASMAGNKEHEDEVYKEMVKQFRLGEAARDQGDKKGAEAFYKKARAALVVGDIGTQKTGLFIQRYLKEHGTTMESVDNSFAESAPQSQYDARRQAFKDKANK